MPYANHLTDRQAAEAVRRMENVVGMAYTLANHECLQVLSICVLARSPAPNTCPDDERTHMPSFEHHGASIYYEEFGQGFPILTLRPLACNRPSPSGTAPPLP